MSELDLLPEPIRVRSISDREIVLPLDAALSAIDYLTEQNIAILGWEGWILTPDGRMGHAYWPHRRADGSVTRGIWHDSYPPPVYNDRTGYVREVAVLARAHLVHAQRLWDEDSGWPGAILHFCLTLATGDDALLIELG